MADYYYLVSSLPMLDKYTEPSMSSDEFVESCEEWLSSGDMAQVSAMSLIPVGGRVLEHGTAAAMWNEWETSLRNKLARARGGKLNREVESDLHDETDCFPEVERVIQEVSAAHNPLEAEKILDDMRWTKLEEIEATHGFDVYTLCAYKLKLQLCEKWMPREEKLGIEKFNEVIDAVNAVPAE